MTENPTCREVWLGDCLEEMKRIDDYSVNMVMTDLPYEKTKLGWDTPIDLEKFWYQIKRIMKQGGCVVMTTQQPFTTKMINSQPNLFKQILVWLKTRPSNVFNAKKMFMNWHEDILVFYDELPTFNPQMIKGHSYRKVHYLQPREKGVYNKTGEKDGHISENNGLLYPSTVIQVSNPNHNTTHPTEKPVKLFEYLIKTYTNEGDLVLDCCSGSGTTAEACINTNRNFIVIEKDLEYFNKTKERVAKSSLTLEAFTQ